MPESQIEFAVQMTCNSCVEAVKKALEGDSNIKNLKIDFEKGSVVVNTTLPTLQVQEKLESTGRKVVVRGYAGSSAGVAILDTGNPNIQGVVRFVQVSPNSCIIDGTVDGLQPGIDHWLNIHECGDLSQGIPSTKQCLVVRTEGIDVFLFLLVGIANYEIVSCGTLNFHLE